MAGLLGLAGYTLFINKGEKTAYFYNQKVFKSFKGTIELEAKLAQQQQQTKKDLDSLAHLIQQGRLELSGQYQKIMEQRSLQDQQLSEQYTNDIWKFINEKANEYGEQEGYDYIFGASGNGSLMYAKHKHDITEDIIEYINKKYESK